MTGSTEEKQKDLLFLLNALEHSPNHRVSEKKEGLAIRGLVIAGRIGEARHLMGSLLDQCCGQDINPRPSAMLDRILDEPHERYQVCDMPWKHAEIVPGGDVFLCCSARNPISVGNCLRQDWPAVWRSPIAMLIRLSMWNGTAVFCRDCPGLKPFRHRVSPSVPGDFPEMLNCAIDNSCNLRCTMCRKKITCASEEELKKRILLARYIRESLLPKINKLYVAGDGEVFFSPVYRELLNLHGSGARYPELNLVTNGLLATRERILFFRRHFERVNVLVSVDAATKEVYESIRRGGDFAILQKKLSLLRGMRDRKEIDRLVMRFVVQQANIGEMASFVSLGEYYHADQVHFSRVVNRTGEAAFYSSVSLMDENRSLRPEFSAMIPEKLRRDPRVYLDPIF